MDWHFGIDTVSHITALNNNGKNIGVLGMGNDEKVFYPKVNLKIYNNMVIIRKTIV